MVTIHNSDDILRLLANKPEWKAAVRREILTEELMNLPARFDQFVSNVERFQEKTEHFQEKTEHFQEKTERFQEKTERFQADTEQFITEQRQFNKDTRQAISELQQFREEQHQFNEEQREFNHRVEGFMDRADARFARIEDDISNMRGAHARANALGQAEYIAEDMGFQIVRSLSRDDMRELVRTSDTTGIPVSQQRSFREADLVIEATDQNGATHYIAVEISNQADERDTRRATRNAEFLTRFTGNPAHAAIASVRNDLRIQSAIDSGQIYWHALTNRDARAE